MACGAISESFPVLNAEVPVARRHMRRASPAYLLSEKQYQAAASLARNCRFFLMERSGFPDRGLSLPLERGAISSTECRIIGRETKRLRGIVCFQRRNLCFL
jgi:hypothetical protein